MKFVKKEMNQMKDWELDGSKVRNGLTSLMANSYSSQLTKNATKQRSNIRCFHKQTIFT